MAFPLTWEHIYNARDSRLTLAGLSSDESIEKGKCDFLVNTLKIAPPDVAPDADDQTKETAYEKHIEEGTEKLNELTDPDTVSRDLLRHFQNIYNSINEQN